EAPEDRKALTLVADRETELAGPGVAPLALGRCPAVPRHRRRPELDLEVEFLSVAGRRGWLGGEQIERAFQVQRRLLVGCTPERAPARLVPGVDCRASVTGLGVMMREQLGLRLGDVGHALDEGLRDATVVATAGRAQHRLVGRILDQRVPED